MQEWSLDNNMLGKTNMKTIAILTQAVSSIYFMGGALAQHPRAKELLSGFENGAASLIKNLQSKEVVSSIRFLIDIFLIIGAASFVGLILLGWLGVKLPLIVTTVSLVFVVSLLFGGSLLWVFKHKEIAKMFWGWFLFFGLGSIAFPLMDILTNIGITHIVYQTLYMPFGEFFGLPNESTFVNESLVVIGFYASGIIVFYLAGWIYSLPVAAIGWFLVISPIYLSKAINQAFPEKPVVAVFFALWLGSFLVLANA